MCALRGGHAIGGRAAVRAGGVGARTHTIGAFLKRKKLIEILPSQGKSHPSLVQKIEKAMSSVCVRWVLHEQQVGRRRCVCVCMRETHQDCMILWCV